MPALPDQWIVAKATDGTEFREQVTASVNGAGKFSVGIPPKLEPIARKLIAPGVELEYIRRGDEQLPRIHSDSLPNAIRFLRACALEFISGTETRETVIVYRIDLRLAAFLSDAGIISPNGYDSTGARIDGNWWKPKLSSSLNATNHARSYSVGLVCQVIEKITTHRAVAGDTVRYERCKNGFNGNDDEAIRSVNSWVGFDFEAEAYTGGGTWQEMPYTPEAAIFFSAVIRKLCEIGKGLDDFFSDKPRFELAIKQGAPQLGF